jgi:methionyl-tRNA formyltransferase
MTLSDEQRDIILQDFLDIFQAKYGENWREKLTSNLRPSPIHQIAEQRGVKVSDVKKVRSQLLAIGQVFQLISTMTQPLEAIQAPFEFQF